MPEPIGPSSWNRPKDDGKDLGSSSVFPEITRTDCEAANRRAKARSLDAHFSRLTERFGRDWRRERPLSPFLPTGLAHSGIVDSSRVNSGEELIEVGLSDGDLAGRAGVETDLLGDEAIDRGEHVEVVGAVDGQEGHERVRIGIPKCFE